MPPRRVVPEHLLIRVADHRERRAQLIGRPVLDDVRVRLPRLRVGHADPLGSCERRQLLERRGQRPLQLVLDVRVVAERLNLAKDRLQIIQPPLIETLKTRQLRAIAMSVYASGAIRPDEAIEWVAGLPNLKAIVFGASSRANIRGTRELVERYWPQ